LIVKDPHFQSHYTYRDYEGWRILSKTSFENSFQQLYTLQCTDFPIYGSFCNKGLNHFFIQLDLPEGKCFSKMKLNFDISVFDNWNQEIFVLTVDNLPEQELEPEKVGLKIIIKLFL
jgi:hypothetical protein